MRHPTPRRRLALLVLALAMVAAACGGEDEDVATGDGDEATAEATGGEISIYIAEPEHLSPPANVTENMGAEVLNALYTPLVQVDFESAEALYGEDEADAVAESIETEDERVFTITLKEGWTFHNGDPVVAQSYVDAWNYGAYGPNANTGAYFFSNIEGYDDLQCQETDDEGNCVGEPTETEMSGLEVLDELSFQVTLTEPFSIFPLVLNYSAFHPVPPDFLDDPEQYVEEPVGNGAFQMDGPWQHNQVINVVRYDDYPGTSPNVDAIEMRIYSEIETAYNDLLAGNLDIMDALPPEQLESAEQEFGDRYLNEESGIIQFLGFPTYDERFTDPNLRKAISMAIDREAIAETVRPDFAPISGFVPEIVPGGLGGQCGGNCTYDLDEAQRLFEEAGGFEGTLTMWFNSGAGHEVWIEAVSNQLRENLGITDIEFETLDFAEYLPLLEGQQVTGPYRLGWIPDYPSPHTYLDSLYATGASANYTGFSNEEFDSLISQGESAEGPEESVQFFQQAEEILNEEMPAIPMFSAASTGAWSERVEGVEVGFFDDLNLREIRVVE